MTCKDCLTEGIATKRPTPHPGPRCATHWRVLKRKRKQRAHGLRIENTYAITGNEYNTLYHYQGGKCAICQRATGKVRKLAVDHDHKAGCDHPPEHGCPICIRGLLCSRCNELIGRYDWHSLARALEYLLSPPARKVFAMKVGALK